MKLNISKCIYKDRLYIEIETKTFIAINSILKLDYEEERHYLDYEGKEHYFAVTEIATKDSDTIKLTCKEIGYFGDFFSIGFDIRELVYETVTLIKDENEIKRLKQYDSYL